MNVRQLRQLPLKQIKLLAARVGPSYRTHANEMSDVKSAVLSEKLNRKLSWCEINHSKKSKYLTNDILSTVGRMTHTV